MQYSRFKIQKSSTNDKKKDDDSLHLPGNETLKNGYSKTSNAEEKTGLRAILVGVKTNEALLSVYKNADCDIVVLWKCGG